MSEEEYADAAIDLIGLIAVASCLFERVGRSLRRIVPVHVHTVHRTVQVSTVSTVRTVAAKVVVVHSLRDECNRSLKRLKRFMLPWCPQLS